MEMELDGIVAFVKVVETGSFTNAARALRQPKSTLSAKVSGLEQRLGVPLLQRTTRHVHLTKAGEVYFRHCIQAIKELELGEIEINEIEGQMKGVLRIAAPAPFSHSILPSLVELYLEAYPEMRVEMITYGAEEDVWSKGVDIAVHIGEVHNPAFVTRAIPLSELYCWAAPQWLESRDLKHPNELSSHDLILYQGFAGVAEIVLNKAQEKITIRGESRITVGDGETAKRFALLGRGIALLPRFLCAEEEKAGKLTQAFPEWSWDPKLPVSLIYPAHKLNPPKINAFLEVLDGRCTVEG